MQAKTTRFDPGGWKAAGTRRQECPRYVAQVFQPAGSGNFPVPGSGFHEEPWHYGRSRTL